jgi:hypothetical protein
LVGQSFGGLLVRLFAEHGIVALLKDQALGPAEIARRTGAQVSTACDIRSDALNEMSAVRDKLMLAIRRQTRKLRLKPLPAFLKHRPQEPMVG